ncbi:hypothetical protein BC961_2822 [Flavobacterium weaverense]|uniref:Uncharacterized protein n=1 Tax=Flavobacterium weaverense TaxID=271156 RepID=A0A3L9ZKU4_9FLAO|nr:hypothetical protein BC961_2822 [Flavobacterium weaverense]
MSFCPKNIKRVKLKTGIAKQEFNFKNLYSKIKV